MRSVSGKQQPVRTPHLGTLDPRQLEFRARVLMAGKVKLLAVTGDRSPVFPDTPTLSQAGVANVKFVSWHGLFAPRGTPAEIVNRISAAITKIGQQAAVRQQFADLGIYVMTDSGAAFNGFIAQQRAAVATIVKERDIRFDE